MIAGERARTLVERILAFSHSGVGERVAVHVEEVVGETLALFAAKLPRHIVSRAPTARERRRRDGRLDADTSGPHESAQPTPCRRCLLVERSVSPWTAFISSTLRGDDGLDRGTGVRGHGSIGFRHRYPAEILERIFDPFFTTKEVGVGPASAFRWCTASSPGSAAPSTSRPPSASEARSRSICRSLTMSSCRASPESGCSARRSGWAEAA
jgi:hypothetical protein